MTIQKLIEGKSELTYSKKKAAPIVLSTRIRLARNLTKQSFPGWSKPENRIEVFDLCEKVLGDLNTLKSPSTFKIDQLDDLEKKVLVERHLISKELSQATLGAGVVVNKDQSQVIMINEEDHLRIQVMRSGYNFKSVWKTIDALDTEIEKRLQYAFSDDLGYLTACPTNLGTGMRASVMLHLPGLVISNQMDKVIRAVNQLGIAVRGIFGEGSDANGSIFQISNQQTLGEDEKQIIKRLGKVLNNIIEQEENCREKLLEKDDFKIKDKVGRAFGILRNAHMMNSNEAMNFLSLIRLGIDQGFFPEDSRPIVDRLFIECQPGHIQYAAMKEKTAEERDALRAEYLRNALRELPSPSYGINENI